MHLARVEGYLMEAVKVTKQRTPTERNQDCQWSIGVMNLTEAEADAIGAFARQVRSVGSDRSRGFTAVEMRQIIAERRARLGPNVTDEQLIGERRFAAEAADWERSNMDFAPTLMPISAQRAQWLTGDWDATPKKLVTTPAKEPLTTDAPNGNRFSGLDLPPADKTE